MRLCAVLIVFLLGLRCPGDVAGTEPFRQEVMAWGRACSSIPRVRLWGCMCL